MTTADLKLAVREAQEQYKVHGTDALNAAKVRLQKSILSCAKQGQKSFTYSTDLYKGTKLDELKSWLVGTGVTLKLVCDQRDGDYVEVTLP